MVLITNGSVLLTCHMMFSDSDVVRHLVHYGMLIDCTATKTDTNSENGRLCSAMTSPYDNSHARVGSAWVKGGMMLLRNMRNGPCTPKVMLFGNIKAYQG